MKSDELRIFISSTFRDLMPEREQLVKKVFPQIRALCRERGVEFTEIDLRWGITDEEARTGKTVRICIEEIDRCRPYFLGIIGSRYGWVPGVEFLGQDETLFHDYPWIEKLGKENKSITDIEFSHGALILKNIHHAFIYEQQIERSALDALPIDVLRSRIEASGVPHHTFASPQELGEKVLRDLTAILDRDWPAKKEMTPAERERTAHEAFAKNRTHSYIANPEYYEKFESFVKSSVAPDPHEPRNTDHESRSSRPLILWGKSGFGKSALMAHLTTEYLHHHPQAFIIRHFVGATASASSADDVIRHIMLEIKERYELTDELPQSDLQSELPVWLAKIKEGEKLILAIDAVNQLTGIGNEMHWLPEFIPANVRLIISTTPELPLEQLRKRNWQELEILPLSSSQRKRISEEFLARYHKKLPHELLEKIGNEAKLESPLFLRTLLEELRIFGVHEAIDVHLNSYLASETEAELFQAVLARMEYDYGEEIVRTVMAAIWASRFGLSETELMEICNLTRLALSEFLIALEFHLMRRTGLFTFFHNYLREAVEERYLFKDDTKKEMHRHLANYFSEEPYDNRRRDEEPWQWNEADDNERLHRSLTNGKMFLLLSPHEKIFELISYWKNLGSRYDPIASYKNLIEEIPSSDIEKILRLSLALALFFKLISKYSAAEMYLKQGLSTVGNKYQDDVSLYLDVLIELGEIYYYEQKFDELQTVSEEALQLLNQQNLSDPMRTVRIYQNLTGAAYALNNAQETLSYAEKSLAIAQTLEKDREKLIGECLENLGAAYTLLDENDKALNAMQKAYEIKQHLLGKAHPQTIALNMNLGNLYSRTKQFVKAEETLKEGVELVRRAFGDEHALMAELYNYLAKVYIDIQDFDKAVEFAYAAVSLSKSILSVTHNITVDYFLTYAKSLALNLQIRESIALYEKYIPEREKYYGIDHPITTETKKFYISLLNL